MPALKKCEYCNGTGKMLCPKCKNEEIIKNTCEKCKGVGFITCEGCMGAGFVDWPYIA